MVTFKRICSDNGVFLKDLFRQCGGLLKDLFRQCGVFFKGFGLTMWYFF